MHSAPFFPLFDEFQLLAQRGDLIPVCATVLADLETPVSAFLKLRAQHAGAPCFLLESVEGGENLARYSFLGVGARGEIIARGREIVLKNDDQSRMFLLEEGQDPLEIIERELGRFRWVEIAGLPHFCGGAVGFLGWDLVRFFEHLPNPPADDRQIPDCHLLLSDTLLVFDAVKHTITVINCAHIESGDAQTAYQKACEKISTSLHILQNTHIGASLLPVGEPEDTEPASNFSSPQAFKDSVARCVELIQAGDCVQIVPSQRFQVEVGNTDSFAIYRALRHISPAPYMVYLSLGETHLLAASPEILVTENKGEVLIRPLAGTRKRGADLASDQQLEAELLADPKEIAEHVMLVDLARNDLGRVCEYGSVKVKNLMYVQKFSHVMHITSDIVGKLLPEKTAYDAIRASFPAGTLSGAPKVRAMQIIDELEPTRRGPYGGAMGYFGFNGNMDTCITLRTIVIKNGIAYVQAGGGVVADSSPEDEYQETRNKARAGLRAIAMALGENEITPTHRP